MPPLTSLKQAQFRPPPQKNMLSQVLAVVQPSTGISQRELRQVWPRGHLVWQFPQWLLFVVVSTQRLLHFINPRGRQGLAAAVGWERRC